MSKPKVLILTDWFVPGYKAGGPIQSVNNLVQLLKEQVEFTVLTSDRDLNETSPYVDIAIDTWSTSRGFKLFYSSPQGNRKVIKDVIENNEFDFIYLNSLFSVDFSLIPIYQCLKKGLLHKVILAPRGMLGEGALQLKPIKKRLFLVLFKFLGIHRKIIFHSTDISETRSIKSALGERLSIWELSNIPLIIDNNDSLHQTNSQSFIFASRISPKKNLLFLLNRLKSLMNADYSLSIYGESDDLDYHQQCISESQNLPVKFFGSVPPVQLHRKLEEHSFFILPTMNENFGHAIIEALSFGCPVIISDQTPWNDLEECGAGWVIPVNDTSRWNKVLNDAIKMSDSDYKKMSENAAAYVKTRFNFEEIRSQYLDLFSAKS